MSTSEPPRHSLEAGFSGRFLSFRGLDPPFATEAELAKAVLADLADWFQVVKTQAPGTHWTGKRLRLDAVLRPLNPEPWFDPDPVIGVEFKNTSRNLGSLNAYMRWAAQAVDYAETVWDNYGRMSIFTCPSITEDCFYLKNGNANAFFVTRMLGQFRVGELGATTGEGWTLRMTGETYWSQRRGVYGAPKSLIPKAGSR